MPEHLRTHGYYVLPLLLGDELVARFDLKADRKASTLRVMGSYVEPVAEPAAILEPAAEELHLLREWLGLDHLAVARRGGLAPGLRRAVAATKGASGRTGATRRRPMPR